MKRGDYDYNHASSNTQFVALLVVLSIIVGVGLAFGLVLLGILT